MILLNRNLTSLNFYYSWSFNMVSRLSLTKDHGFETCLCNLNISSSFMHLKVRIRCTNVPIFACMSRFLHVCPTLSLNFFGSQDILDVYFHSSVIPIPIIKKGHRSMDKHPLKLMLKRSLNIPHVSEFSV